MGLTGALKGGAPPDKVPHRAVEVQMRLGGLSGFFDALRTLVGTGPRLPQQISRLPPGFARALAALLVARRLLIPKTFGDLGHYRASAIGENAVLGIKYAG